MRLQWRAKMIGFSDGRFTVAKDDAWLTPEAADITRQRRSFLWQRVEESGPRRPVPPRKRRSKKYSGVACKRQAQSMRW